MDWCTEIRGRLDHEAVEVWLSGFDSKEQGIVALVSHYDIVTPDEVLAELRSYLKSEYNCGNRALKKALEALDEELSAPGLYSPRVLKSWEAYFPESWDVAYLFKPYLARVFFRRF